MNIRTQGKLQSSSIQKGRGRIESERLWQRQRYSYRERIGDGKGLGEMEKIAGPSMGRE